MNQNKNIINFFHYFLQTLQHSWFLQKQWRVGFVGSVLVLVSNLISDCQTRDNCYGHQHQLPLSPPGSCLNIHQVTFDILNFKILNCILPVKCKCKRHFLNIFNNQTCFLFSPQLKWWIIKCWLKDFHIKHISFKASWEKRFYV